MKTYQLKNFDKVLLEFVLEPSTIGTRKLRTVFIDETGTDELPINLDVNDVMGWISGRSIPKNREFVLDVLNSIGDFSNPMRIIDVSFGLSLNDAYWITPKGFEGTFEQYNLYDNPFSEALKLVAFTGNSQPIKGIATSPELTTNGMLKKCWHREEQKTFLYKGGTSGFANTGLEPYSEYYAYQVGKRMGLDIIEYDLKKFKGELVSSCELFTSKGIGYSPIWQHADIKIIEDVIEIYGKEKFADMVVFDTVICNTDRHYGNFGVLVDNHTRKVMGPAPIFDNGLSLFCYAMEDDFEKGIESHHSAGYNAFNASPVEMSKLLMTNRQRKMLRKLIGFRFERHPLYNLPEWRLKAIEDFIQYRVGELLGESNANCEDKKILSWE